jgi:hypothetical protein
MTKEGLVIIDGEHAMDCSRATEDLGGGGGDHKGHMIALLLRGLRY